MARYGVIGDVHGNAEALEAALRELERCRIDALLCVGDLVGFNASSDEVTRRLQSSAAVCIAGNHDRIALGRLVTTRCSYKVAHALKRTRHTLGDDSRRFLEGLALTAEHDGHILMFHGSMDDVERYSRSLGDIQHNEALVNARHPNAQLCFYGHTHKPAVHSVSPAGVVTKVPTGATVGLDGDSLRYFMNPGSVDAARRGGARAQLAVYDSGSGTLELRTVDYDHHKSELRARRDGYRMNVAMRAGHEAAGFARRGAYRLLNRVRTALEGRLEP